MFFFLLLAIFCHVCCATVDQVIAVYRHGDRAPAFAPFPTDPNQNYQWEEGLGNLTSLGRYQAFHLGQQIKELYKDFLSNEINEVCAWSSSEPRCIATTACVLTGLYRPDRPEFCFVRNHAPPAPINITVDYILNNSPDCPAKKEQVFLTFEDSNFKNMLSKRKNLLKIMEKESGLKMTGKNDSFLVTIGIYDTLSIERTHNVTWHKWAESIWNEMTEMNTDIFQMLTTSTERSIKIQAGFLLKDIIDRLQNKNTQQKLFLYGTHDLFLKALMGAIGVDNGQQLPYCSSLFFELHKDTDSVRLLFRNSSVDAVYPLTVPGCSLDCPIQKFVKLTEKYVLTDKDKECKLLSP